MKKQAQAEKIFGKEESRFYKIRRNTFFTGLIILFVLGFFIRRYFNALTNLEYLELVNIASLIGLILVIGAGHLFDYTFDLKLRKRDYFFVYFMTIAGITLSMLYYKIPNYDKVEHLLFPMMFASIAFYILTRKLKISLGWRLFLTFFIIVGSLSIFEVIEYFLDLLFNWKMQGVFIEDASGNFIEVLDRINDTMIDIALGILGTLIYIFSVLFIERNKPKH